uniref:Maturase K n=1 Tax=Laminaria rodriguezii TaxID=1740620 RepID=A0A7U1AQC0_9PHAE|nr:hypothetical protein K4Y99_mgp18 [Laminaria rodriguezii]QQY84974.1 hypothetical protein [Laminaria rodriguezii]
MEKAKRYSKTDLADFYAVSPVFKRYSQFNLWSDNFSEYHNIKYCNIYLSQYIFGRIQKYILEHFSESFLLSLYSSPRFLKFIKSGFFKYINFHFFFFFQNNRFFFSENSHEGVEIFVEAYFQRYIKIFFERDLLRCLVACIYEIVPKSFRGYLNNRLKFIYTELLLVKLITRSSPNSVSTLNLVVSNKNKDYSLSLIKEIPSVLTPSFSSFFLENSGYTWGHYLMNTYKTPPPQIFNYILFDLDKTSTVYKYLIYNKKIEFSLRVYSSFLSKYNWYFYTFSQCIYKFPNRFTSNYLKKGSNNCNCNFQLLLESFQVSVSFDKKQNDIGIYRESASVFF